MNVDSIHFKGYSCFKKIGPASTKSSRSTSSLDAITLENPTYWTLLKHYVTENRSTVSGSTDWVVC